MDPMLIRACQRAHFDPYFVAYHLGPDLPAAAVRLGITVDQACHLYLCPVPTSGCEVRRIAEAVGVSETVVRAAVGW